MELTLAFREVYARAARAFRSSERCAVQSRRDYDRKLLVGWLHVSCEQQVVVVTPS
mgnify:FL=1